MGFTSNNTLHVTLTVCVLICCSSSVFAQEARLEPINAVVDTLESKSPDSALVLKPWIIPGSERLTSEGRVLSDSLFRIDYRQGRLWLADTTASPVVIVYRTYPFSFRSAYAKRRIEDAGIDTFSVRMLREMAVVAQEEEARGTAFLGETSKLERHGSISRGIIAGNNRDVSLESGLRIQLAGEVTEGVNVRAVLTDESTPIQPDGTTQRLNEFDRVFMELQAGNGTATLGDYDLRFRSSRFGLLNRKLQGISVAGRSIDPPGDLVGKTGTTVAGAVARGIFRSQEITPIDGVQGPYRMTGRDGEQFIIVVAGSERVYLDGQLLDRGESNDYIIDYATGEVTFSSRRIITEDRRIRVEFEYTANQFTSTIIATESTFDLFQREDGSARGRFGVTFLREGDGKDLSDELGFTAADSLALVNAGDDLATRSGEELVPFDPEAGFVQYVRRDTTFDGNVLSIFVPLTDTSRVDSVFRVRFTRVTTGTGDYRRSGTSLNGVVFQWVGPDHGDYVARRVIPSPKLQRLFDLNGSFELVQGVEVYGEWARSMNDLNRLSSLDSGDDVDDAYDIGFRIRPTPVEFGRRRLGRASAGLQRRHVGEQFEAFERTRDVEFGREWNLARPISATGGSGANENTTEGFLQFDVAEASFVRADVGRLILDGGFEGSRVKVEGRTAEEGAPDVHYRLARIRSDDQLRGESGTWLRQLGRASYTIAEGRFTPGIEIEHEDREQRSLTTDSLLNRSFSFIEMRPGVTYGGSRSRVGLSVEYRTERAPLGDVMSLRSKSWTGQIDADLRLGGHLSTRAEIGYRRKRFTDEFAARGDEDSETVAVQSTSRFSGWSRAVQGSFYYEALSERSPLLQETYVRTGSEIGQYVWEDANSDGVRQVDEFISERTPFEGTYVRTFIPSDELASIINVQARLRLDLNPRQLFGDEAGAAGRMLSKVSSQTVLEVAEKSTEDDIHRIYLLDLSRFRDAETTLSGRLRMEERLELFRGVVRYGLQASVSDLRSLSSLAAGSEERLRRVWRLTGRYRPGRRVQFRILTSREINRSTSSQFDSRTFDFLSLRLEPEVSFSLARGLSTTVAAEFASKDDRSAAGSEPLEGTILKVPIELRYALPGRMQVSGRFEVADVDVGGDARGLSSFELTDGRGPGTSLLWNVTGNYAVTEMIRSSLSYDGRSPSEAPTIHTVRVQFSLVF